MSRLVWLPLSLLCLSPLARAAPPASGSDASPESVARAFIGDLQGGRFTQAESRFAPKIQALVSKEQLAAGWKQLTAPLGRFERIESVETKPLGRMRKVLATTRFSKSTVRLSVVVGADGKVVGFHILPAESAAWTPPAYAHRDRFVERKVRVGVAPELPGYITLPKGEGPFPAVVLIPGSGAENANEAIGPNRVFEDLAWGLSSQGIVVLRYDKRTLVQPEGVRTVKEEYLDGAHGAVQLLLHLPKVDPRRIVIAGHSEGGYLAPRIAKANPQVAGLVVLEGNTRALGDAMVDQLHYLLSLHPESVKLKTLAAESTKWRARMQSPDLKPSDEIHLPLGGGVTLPGSYVLDLRGYHPAKLAAKLGKPILLTEGGRDYQVTNVDFQVWKKALHGRRFAQLDFYPALNHLLMKGTGKPSPKEYMRPGQHVSERVVDDIVTWVRKLKN